MLRDVLFTLFGAVLMWFWVRLNRDDPSPPHEISPTDWDRYERMRRKAEPKP